VKRKIKMGKRVIMMITMMGRIIMMKMTIQKRKSLLKSLKRGIRIRK